MSMNGGGQRGFVPDLGELRLIWMTDTHILSTPTEPRDSGVIGALAEANSWQADAVIHTGDIGDNYAANVARGFALLRGTAINGQLITVVGNHDENEYVADGASIGNPNTSTIVGASYFNRTAPFNHTGTLSASNGALKARWLTVDNNFYSELASDPTVVNSGHSIGGRVGHSGQEPSGGSYRQYGATQIAWIADTLAADTTSHMILLLNHYPMSTTQPTDIAGVMDVLQADKRPTLILCGHTHPNAELWIRATSDGRRSYTGYKCPAGQESGAYTRLRIRVGNRNSPAPLVVEASVRNYTNPGGWTIAAPFVVVP